MYANLAGVLVDRNQCRRLLSPTAPRVHPRGSRLLLAAYGIPRAYIGGRNPPDFYYYDNCVLLKSTANCQL